MKTNYSKLSLCSTNDSKITESSNEPYNVILKYSFAYVQNPSKNKSCLDVFALLLTQEKMSLTLS